MDQQTLTKYIYAFTFGDGCISFPKKKKPDSKNNPFMAINHVIDNEDYVLWKKDILENLTNVYLYRRPNTGQDVYYLKTARHPQYRKVYDKMYLHGRKVIDPHFEAFLDWETMAIIYQDDGCLKLDSNDRSIYIATNNFTYGDQLMFRNWCAKNLDMHFSINRHMNSWRLRLSSKCVDEFLENVKPYIFSSFRHKLFGPDARPL